MALLLAGAPAAAAEGPLIAVPSGEKVWWQETITGQPGSAGLTYRYRFVMPRLAELVPATAGPATGEETPEDAAELDSLSGNGMMDGPGQEIDLSGTGVGDAAGVDDGQMVDLEDLNLPDLPPEADLGDDGVDGAVPVPPEPEVLQMDPVHADITWLCENWVLPRLAPPAPRPAQVVISLADRETVFGSPSPDAVQLFEAFDISDDGKSCTWSPW